jgi:glutamine cyclotransferase
MLPLSCNPNEDLINTDNELVTYTYNVTAAYPHDANAQTEGLEFADVYLYEGTGPNLDSGSSLRRIDLETGTILQIHLLDEPYFGEGITKINDLIYQVTYQARQGFIYDAESFEQIGTFRYETEGWGLTNNGHLLIMSNGSNQVVFIDPVTFNVARTLDVWDSSGPVYQLNELEYIDGYIYANIFNTDKIVRFQESTGEIVETIFLSNLLSSYFERQGDILRANGIAYNSENGRLFITGKYWPLLFELTRTEN